MAEKICSEADVRALATAVFGSQEAGIRWLSAPALALDGQRPIDLLGISEGCELVGDLLVRLEFGVYT